MLGGVKPVLVRQHVDTAPAGLLGKWLDARGIAYELDRTWLGASVPDPERYAWIASLGVFLRDTPQVVSLSE